MTNYLSEKIKFISFITMIMVLFVHSFNSTLYPVELIHTNHYATDIQNFISFHVCRIAVPFFYILSGFLFFLNFELTFTDYINKLKSRCNSLVIPYFLWVCFWTSFFYILSHVSFTKGFINSPLSLRDFSFSSLISIFNSPICYQFWFIKDLILLVIFSPILYFLIKKIALLFLVILYINLVYYNFDLFFFSNIAVFYFSVGVFIAFNFKEINRIKINLHYTIIGIIWILLYFLNRFEFSVYFIPLIIFIGLLFVWKLYDNVNQDHKIYLIVSNWSSFSFFLFALHEPLFISMKKLGFLILGKTPYMSLVLYFSLPFFVFTISIFIGFLTKKYTPTVFKVMTGGR
jgi:surface polysaccharide O-acyltransferase-like enzyme